MINDGRPVVSVTYNVDCISNVDVDMRAGCLFVVLLSPLSSLLSLSHVSVMYPPRSSHIRSLLQSFPWNIDVCFEELLRQPSWL